LLDPTPFDIISIVERVAEIFAYKISEKKLELIVDVDPDMPRYYIGDPVRIRQILWNLVGNSVKFTDQGFIKIEAGKLRNAEVGLCIQVTDTGIGIPAEQMAHIFKEFKQADNSASRKYSGTGLGLAIVERLVLMMNGKVSVQSEVNRGATFCLSLPLIPQQKSPLINEHIVLQQIRDKHLELECFTLSNSEQMQESFCSLLGMCNIKHIPINKLETFLERYNFYRSH
jgi:signal transduction histidine kinase